MEGNKRHPDSRPLPEAGQDRLHVSVGPACNNNCIFCIEERREDRFALVSRQTASDVRLMLGTGGTREVMFVSGEPTLNEALPLYVGMAREAGFATIGLITNGRRLAYRSYAASLLEAGLNHVLVSIHGPDARTHDSLTRTRGSFAQTMAGLANLASLRAEHPGLSLHTATCVTRRNVGKLAWIVEATSRFDVDRHVFNVMMPEGRGLTHVEALMPKYREVVRAFGDLTGGMSEEEVRRIALLNVPLCTSEGLPQAVRGYVEEYHSYEMEGACPLKEWDEDFVDALIEDGRTFVRGAIKGDGSDYSLVAKSFHDEHVRVKGEGCGRCRYFGACPGVYEAYVARYGWEEMVPVAPPPAGHGE